VGILILLTGEEDKARRIRTSTTISSDVVPVKYPKQIGGSWMQHTQTNVIPFEPEPIYKLLPCFIVESNSLSHTVISPPSSLR